MILLSMRSIAVLPALGLLLMPLEANAACSFLPPVGAVTRL